MSIAARASHALPLWRVLLLCLIPLLLIALILLLVRVARARFGDQPVDLAPQPQPRRHPRRLVSHHSRTRMETETGAIAPLTGRAKGWVPVGETDPRRFHADGGDPS